MTKPIQKIVFGSPGTGKSYKIDRDIIPNNLDIDIEQKPENVIKCVFHPEYTYGDFMGKLLPITRSGKVEYNFYEGHFLRALSQAYRNIVKSYDNKGDKIEGYKVENVVLVIDEINRGNSSSIFGSVFQLLDRGEDGWSSYSISIQGMIFNKLLELLKIKTSEKQGVLDAYYLPVSSGEIRFNADKANIDFLKFDLANKMIKIPFNLSILATMNTSDSSIYYMDSAFKRRWDWEFIDVNSSTIEVKGVAFESREDWERFVDKLNAFIKSNHKYIRGIEDKQVGRFFINDSVVSKVAIQNKLMFFIWDNVFARDKKPINDLLYGDSLKSVRLITFGDFAKEVDLFINRINSYV